MKKFMKVWIILLIILFLSPLNSFAGRPMDSTYVASDTANAVSSSKEIYGYTMIATDATAEAALYDVATIAATSNTNIVSEATEALLGDSQTIWFPKPKVFPNGCTVILDTAVVIIYHSE